jgi:hypothetical protein
LHASDSNSLIDPKDRKPPGAAGVQFGLIFQAICEIFLPFADSATPVISTMTVPNKGNNSSTIVLNRNHH